MVVVASVVDTRPGLHQKFPGSFSPFSRATVFQLPFQGLSCHGQQQETYQRGDQSVRSTRLPSSLELRQWPDHRNCRTHP